MPHPGTLINQRYQVIRQVGQGGMGAVYEAVDTRLGHRVALKQTLITDPQYVRAFEREARLLAYLKHAHLPRVTDHFSDADGQFLVMDFILGEDLAQLFQQHGGPFALAQVLTWADQLLDALEYLHSQQPPVLHRDIKPQNLKLTPDGTLFLLDFGLAKGALWQTHLTGGGSITGYTPAYAPLEQIQGTGTDARSDLYAVGATLYHLLAGAPPPDALTRTATIVRRQPDPLRPPHVQNPTIPAAVGAILLHAMELNPDDRPASAMVLRAALRAAPSATASPPAVAPTQVIPPPIQTAQPRSGQPAFAVGTPTINMPLPEMVPAPATPKARNPLLVWIGILVVVLIGMGALLVKQAIPVATANPTPAVVATRTPQVTVVSTVRPLVPMGTPATEAPAITATTILPTATTTVAATVAGLNPTDAGSVRDYIVTLAAQITPAIARSLGTVKIVSHTPLSGFDADLGTGISNGVDLGIAQIGTALAATGLKLELAPFDDQSQLEVGASNAKAIVADSEMFCVVGHLNSGVALAALPDYSYANLLMISPANTNPRITDSGYANAFRVVGRDDLQGPIGARFANETLKAKTVFILHDTTDYGQGVAEFFRQEAERLGIKVLGFEDTQEKSDFSSILTVIQAANPDLIYFGGLYLQAGPLLRQARDRGITTKFLGPDGLDTSALAKLAGTALSDTYYTTVVATVSDYPNAAQFALDYKARFNNVAPPFSAQAFDATNFCTAAILKAAVEAKGKPTRAQVVAAMKSLPTLDGITATYTFNSQGDPNPATYYVFAANTDPAKWSQNKLVTRILSAPPTLR